MTTTTHIKFGDGLAVTDEGAGVIRVDGSGGPTGPQGPKGDTGATGATGPAGTTPDISGKVDRDAVEAATNRLVQVKLAAADTQPAFKILGDGKHQWGGGGTLAPDVSLTRVGASHLRTDGLLQAVRVTSSDPALSAAVAGEGTARLVIPASGSLNWSAGTGSLDTDLYRTGAGQLRTSGTLNADANITAKNASANQAYIGDVGAVPGLALGSAADTKLYRDAANRLATNGDLRLGGQLWLNSAMSGSVSGAQPYKFPVYNSTGVFLGYVPVYAA